MKNCPFSMEFRTWEYKGVILLLYQNITHLDIYGLKLNEKRRTVTGTVRPILLKLFRIFFLRWHVSLEWKGVPEAGINCFN